jgi:hypothetical protein
MTLAMDACDPGMPRVSLTRLANSAVDLRNGRRPF